MKPGLDIVVGVGKPKPPRPPDGMNGPKPPMDDMPEEMDEPKEDGGMAEVKDMLMKICQALGIEGYGDDGGGEMPQEQPMPMGDEGE